MRDSSIFHIHSDVSVQTTARPHVSEADPAFGDAWEGGSIPLEGVRLAIALRDKRQLSSLFHRSDVIRLVRLEQLYVLINGRNLRSGRKVLYILGRVTPRRDVGARFGPVVEYEICKAFMLSK